MSWPEFKAGLIIIFTVIAGGIAITTVGDFEACVDVEVKQEQQK